jgi:uncharacterized membrane protein YdcZ (DUF606 family)
VREVNLETEVIRGFALAAVLFGFGTLAAALAAGGNVPMIALGLILAALSMDLFRIAGSREEDGPPRA